MEAYTFTLGILPFFITYLLTDLSAQCPLILFDKMVRVGINVWQFQTS